jgi:hypothetical protein
VTINWGGNRLIESSCIPSAQSLDSCVTSLCSLRKTSARVAWYRWLDARECIIWVGTSGVKWAHTRTHTHTHEIPIRFVCVEKTASSPRPTSTAPPAMHRLSCFVAAIAIGDLVKSTLGPKGMVGRARLTLCCARQRALIHSCAQRHRIR